MNKGSAVVEDGIANSWIERSRACPCNRYTAYPGRDLRRQAGGQVVTESVKAIEDRDNAPLVRDEGNGKGRRELFRAIPDEQFHPY